MMIFGICASPRNQTTEFVLKEALNILNKKSYETKLFSSAGKQIASCMHCDYCMEHKECVIKDDMVEVYENLKKADGIVIATPVQSGGASAQLCSIMDRTRALEAIDYNLLRGKIGMGIAVGGDRTGGQDMALLKIITYYMIHGIIPVSGGPFGSNLGAYFYSKDSLEEIRNDDYGFESLNRTIEEFVKFIEKYI
ncbi:flavodoxin family protein [Methanobrevibacter sp. DSM 116169]|uniref:flavodoxin family protein n=1 Tax=Methanobrevibacter sp. DSM 116169 TaxID=3242727 RepID=UPI0038FC3B39